MSKKQLEKGQVSLGNKIAFGVGDIFGGGSFNIINFLFTPFLTLIVGIPMIWLTPILLLTKIWDGIIDPWIGRISDGTTPGKFGKRRIFMLIFAPLVCIFLILLFFPWNLIIDSVLWKCIFVVLIYMLYATAQSFVLIPYYSHASEMTDDFTSRNNTNAVRLAFSILSSIVCVAVPRMLASPEIVAKRGDGGMCYVVMAAIFGVIFMVSILITALFSREQIVTPPVKKKFSFKEFVRPLKVKTYRQYLGMQMCSSMAMAMMSSFFFTFCDFYLRRATYQEITLFGGDRPIAIATVAAAMMFVAQIIALPLYLKLIKTKSKRFAYITGCVIWMVVVAFMWLLKGESAIDITYSTKIIDGKEVIKKLVATSQGTPDWLIIVFGLLLGLGIGGTVFVPHSSFGDVCDVGELYFGERTEGAFSGITNFLNTTAQALGLAIPPMIIGLAGYVETQYVSIQEFLAMSGMTAEQLQSQTTGVYESSKYTLGNGQVQLLPASQPQSAQLALRICFIVLPIVIMTIAIVIASRYKLTSKLQQQIVEANARTDKDSEDFKQTRQNLLNQL